MKKKDVILEIQKRLEARRDEYRAHGKLCGPGQHRELCEERASLMSEALVIVNDVEKELLFKVKR